MFIGTMLYFLTYILYFFDFGLTFLIITRLLNGFATGIISTAFNTLATGFVYFLMVGKRGSGSYS